MTDVALVTWTGDHGVEREMFPTTSLANKAASELRKAGISSKVEKITLSKLGKKQLIASVYNNEVHGEKSFVASAELVKDVEGVKKPSDPVAAAKLKARQVANKHRGVAPPSAASSAPGAAGTENPPLPAGASGSKSSPNKEPSTTGSGAGKAATSKKSPTKAAPGAAESSAANGAPAGGEAGQVNKTVSEQAPKAENKGDMTSADLDKAGKIVL